MPSSHSARKGLLIGAVIVASLAAVAVLTGSEAHTPANVPGKTAPTARAGRPAQNSCTSCLERNPLLNPARFNGWNDADVKASYEAANKYPDTIDRIHCFCECKESPREQHKTLLTCFTTQHAAGCGICQHEAILAAKLKDQGASDDEVESTVERLHRTDGHPPTKGRGI
jgi:Protein of unknown function with PCYCGC motif